MMTLLILNLHVIFPSVRRDDVINDHPPDGQHRGGVRVVVQRLRSSGKKLAHSQNSRQTKHGRSGRRQKVNRKFQHLKKVLLVSSWLARVCSSLRRLCSFKGRSFQTYVQHSCQIQNKP